MIEQRQNDLLPTDFEASADDTEGFGMDQFQPQ